MDNHDVRSCEMLYRQIPHGHEYFFNSEANPCVHPSSFHPSPKDDDGLSLIRSKFRGDEWAAHRAETPLKEFKIARINAGKALECGLAVNLADFSFLSSPDSLDEHFGAPWAHCLATKINKPDFQKGTKTRELIKQWAWQIAESIEIADVLGPYPKPPGEINYRPPGFQESADSGMTIEAKSRLSPPQTGDAD